MSEWYTSWFDSPLYHLLYKHRDKQEAASFLNLLLTKIQVKPEAVFHDRACGRGRHTHHIARLGYKAYGTDLSSSNIRYARRYFGKLADFEILDMREIYKDNFFDVVLCLFTSFGYFDADQENEKVLGSIYSELKPGGLLVIDFMNPVYAEKQIRPLERKKLKGIEFIIKRSLTETCFVKEIEAKNDTGSAMYMERVKAYTFPTLKNMLNKFNLQVEMVFGNYALESFDETNSDRIIIIAKK